MSYFKKVFRVYCGSFLSFCSLFCLGFSGLSQPTTFLDSVLLLPIENVRVYSSGKVYFSDKHGTIDSLPSDSKAIFSIHPRFETKQILVGDTNYLTQNKNSLLSPVEVKPKLNPTNRTINKRNPYWRFSHVSISDGAIHGVGTKLNNAAELKGVTLFFKDRLKAGLQARILIFDSRDTLSESPEVLNGSGKFDTIPEGVLNFELILTPSLFIQPHNSSLVLCVEFKYDRTQWAGSTPKLEMWESDVSNYYYFHQGRVLFKARSLRKITKERTVGISFSLTQGPPN